MSVIQFAITLSYRLVLLAGCCISNLFLTCAPSQADNSTPTANFAPFHQAFKSTSAAGVPMDAAAPPIIKQYGIKEGLPTHYVKGAVEDQQGFIWFGTAGGLVRFDGYTFKKYPCQLNDSVNIGADRVMDLIIDGEGELWISRSFRPLERFDPRTERSISYASARTNLPMDHAYDLYFDPPHTIWVGHSRNGMVSKLNKKTGEVVSYKLAPRREEHTNNEVWSIHRDHDGDLWAATRYGLYLFDSLASDFKYYDFLLQGTTSPTWFDNVQDFKPGKVIMETTLGPTVLDKSNGHLEPLFEFPEKSRSGINGYFIRDQNILWIANYVRGKVRGGVIKYNLDTDEAVFFTMAAEIPLLKDRSGNVWLHQGGFGVSSFNPAQGKFSSYEYPLTGKITSVAPFKNDHLWIATEKALFKLEIDPQRKLKIIEELTPKIGAAKIHSVLQARDSTLWIATSHGIIRHNPDNSAKTYNPLSSGAGKETGSTWQIADLFEDREGKIWACGSELVEINPESGVHKRYKSQAIRRLDGTREDAYGNLWFTNSKSVIVFNKNKSRFHDIKVPFTNSVKSIYLDAKNAWIGTNTGLYGMKLTDFDSLAMESNNVQCYNHLMPENYAASVEGNQGILWVVYARGLAKIDIENNRTEAFGSDDGLSEGLVTDDFIGAFTDNQNNLYLCWDYGLKSISTKEVKYNDYLPPVAFTDFKVFNESIKIGDSVKNHPVLARAIYDTESVRLPTGVSFTLEFAALDYTNPEKNLYSYMLEGVDEKWSPSDKNRSVTFANLSPGEYTFRVTACNNDGIWNKTGQSLSVIIYPAWWQTWWAISLYLLCALGLLVGLGYRERKRFMLKQQAETLKEINRVQSEFFTNISHELRTPLTLILGPLKALRSGTYTGDTGSLLKMMAQNGDRLHRLVNQLLDLSKLDLGKMQLQYQNCNINQLIKSVVTSFDSAASAKQIDLEFTEEYEDIYSWVDEEKIKQVLYNLVGNAIKFTLEGGSVHLALAIRPEHQDRREVIEITIRDSGIGIPKEELTAIFNRFHQVNQPNNFKAEGTGIGLALAQSLVAMHHGSIQVESKLAKGTTFTVILPKISNPNGAVVTSKLGQTAAETPPPGVKSEGEAISRAALESSLKTQNQPVLLIVEDNLSMRQFIKDCLGPLFSYLESSNGKEGLEISNLKQPDLIISDILMPEMDGYEFCKRIREQETTSHIPFIFLTAKADHVSQIKGLQIGSNDYIVKPFDAEELRLKVVNHLNRIAQFRKFFTRQLEVEGDIEVVESIDEKFLKRAIDVVKRHLDDHEFTVIEFSEQVGMSQTQLYRKLMAITGQSPTAFIRSIRLKKAAQLILQNYGNTSQVAYAVGFNTLSYFAKCFKEQFGVLPSNYGKTHSGEV